LIAWRSSRCRELPPADPMPRVEPVPARRCIPPSRVPEKVGHRLDRHAERLGEAVCGSPCGELLWSVARCATRRACRWAMPILFRIDMVRQRLRLVSQADRQVVRLPHASSALRGWWRTAPARPRPCAWRCSSSPPRASSAPRSRRRCWRGSWPPPEPCRSPSECTPPASDPPTTRDSQAVLGACDPEQGGVDRGNGGRETLPPGTRPWRPGKAPWAS
jgi:hypothetical protein